MGRMGARLLLIVSIPAALILVSEDSRAQEESTDAHVLPTLRVTAPASHPKRNPPKVTTPAPAAPETKPTIYPTTPMTGAGIASDKVPASLNVVSEKDIERTETPIITDALRQYVPGASITEVAGNPFQPNLEFRGFVASPVSGTPQGLAVYQNGVRINEAFGDTVNWDLIPTAAIQSVTLVTNNPAFGLNALGGAVDVQMKNGFLYHGAEINTMGGSFGRIQSSLQWGKQVDNYSVYGALEGAHDDGFRNFSTSNIRRFYGDVGVKNSDAEIHFNMGVARSDLGAP